MDSVKRRQFSGALAAAVLLGNGPARALSAADATAGVRAALERGATVAVDLLGRPDGFLGNPKLRIPLPGALEDVARLLRKLGQGQRVDELVTTMNRAAEAAMPEARAVLVDAVRRLSVQDAVAIVRGGATSVTDFFARQTREPLAARLLPIVTRATQKVKLADRYNALAAKAQSLGLLQGDAVNLQSHVTAKALDGLYLTIGEEEQRLRADPVGTGSRILRQVFGG